MLALLLAIGGGLAIVALFLFLPAILVGALAIVGAVTVAGLVVGAWQEFKSQREGN